MEEIINSVMQSPENTNPNVLRSQLSKMGGAPSSDVNKIIDLHNLATPYTEPGLSVEDFMFCAFTFSFSGYTGYLFPVSIIDAGSEGIIITVYDTLNINNNFINFIYNSQSGSLVGN